MRARQLGRASGRAVSAVAAQERLGRGGSGACVAGGAWLLAERRKLLVFQRRAEHTSGARVGKGLVDWDAKGKCVNSLAEEGWVGFPVARLDEGSWLASTGSGGGIWVLSH